MPKEKIRAVVLLSGGLDSAVTLYSAIRSGRDCHAVTFNYGQRHKRELRHARKLASEVLVPIREISLSLPFTGSSLVDKAMDIPKRRTVKEIKESFIPSTYVPSRNIIFLSIAASYAESIGASEIYIGAHYTDSSGYPDCRRDFLNKFDKALKAGTKRGAEGRLSLKHPLIDKTKDEIIKLGFKLGVPFEYTWSCYNGGVRPCGECDSCVLRKKGFKEIGVKDPSCG